MPYPTRRRGKLDTGSNRQTSVKADVFLILLMSCSKHTQAYRIAGTTREIKRRGKPRAARRQCRQYKDTLFIPASPVLAGEILRNHGTFHQMAQGKISALHVTDNQAITPLIAR
ncbi:hypothetical protein FPE49_002288 [Salmonella bongori]|nr:hypothetical protein [Salmonella bongori]